ncbi:MAG: Bax inhibitor-1/YccA family protein [Flavobacteriia bacterium]|nr:Bax inhibitor-1/YccA family protein [Flavobacteriia bacterium]OJX39847.1 MAG: hypothetical protein BGO87_02495 [Flavobacteriia bacterium 40-80]
MEENFIQERGSFSKELSRDFFKKVYAYMGLALLISGGVAYYIGSSAETFKNLFFTEQGSISPLFYIIAFAPVGLALVIQMAYRSLSIPILMLLFTLYSAMIGASLSTIFFNYSIASIMTTFFVSAGTFIGMAVLGYTTKTDLTKMGSLLYMVFIGMFIASIANFFINSEGVSWWISFLGVFVFTGLTAYWMQQLKGVAENSMLDGVERDKLALVGGLNLYILFVNLFLSLLRLFGNRD